MKDLAVVYYGADRPGANIPDAPLNSCWNEDLKKIDVPTLILHGDVDQIVPIGNAYRSAKLIPNATLKEYPGAPHAIISTSKNEVNEDLLAFIGERIR